VETRIAFSLTKHEPWQASLDRGTFTYEGRAITVPMPGEFSLKNALAAAELCYAFGASLDAIERGLASLTRIPGRAERIDEGQDFTVIVDYAHTPDSLRALYEAFSSQRRICIVSATGGGRDTWKRPVMGKIADDMCDEVIVTDEDPYDEDPRSIMESVARGMQRRPHIVLNRREAIATALSLAKTGDAVLLTGKGTDQYIHRARGSLEPWDDARVAREELNKLIAARRV
jgi:UDP-N-acetylmuramoyl-L-alanyl-D-glutamate--2,6-diaminopimelate ligase